MMPDGLHFLIGEVPHTLPAYTVQNLKTKQHYNEGDLIWGGTVYAGDHITANRTAFLFKDPKRGDIIIFRTNDLVHPGVRTDTAYVKRIVGLPGETVQIQDGKIIIDGNPVTEPEHFYKTRYNNAGKLSTPEDSIILSKDEYLTLGDNTAPNNSLDGRFYGPISRDSILAKVSTIYWPLNRIGAVE